MKTLSCALFAGLLALSGCGKGDSASGPSAPVSLNQAQASLPDSGYWLCRLDFKYRDYYGYYKDNGYILAGEGRSAVKAQISEICLKGSYSEECSAAIARREFQCARAQNTGGLSEYPAYVVCNLPFKFKDYYGYYKDNSYRASGANQGEAMTKIFDSCRKGSYSEECSRAIFNGAVACSTVE